MKILSVQVSTSAPAFRVRTAKSTYEFPFNKAQPSPSHTDPVVSVARDPELGNEGFTYYLQSGQVGSVHIDTVREVALDPDYLAELEAYRLTLPQH
jgi:hypothetical protein